MEVQTEKAHLDPNAPYDLNRNQDPVHPNERFVWDQCHPRLIDEHKASKYFNEANMSLHYPVMEQMKCLCNQKGQIANGAVIEGHAYEFKRGWAKATPAMKKRLVNRLLRKLVWSSEGLYTSYITDKVCAEDALVPQRNRAPEDSSGARSNVVSFNRRPSGFHLSQSASVVQSGGDEPGSIISNT
jgi:hypothetical protein